MVRFDTVTRRFADVTAVDRLGLDIREGEFFALLGPSGCGKTTLLRMLAGFERPDDGRILLAGEDIAAVPPWQRPVNMMFQSYALFPHLTVAGNIAFGLKQERLPRPEIDARVAEMLRLVRLEGLGGRRPHQLSGGQRQRVALARALAKHPKVLLLDEPLAALDKKLREETQFELMALQERLATTFVIVTHDQEEAMTMADRIGVMNHGRLAQVGTPAEIYEQPRSRWVAGFIGDVNLIDGTVAAIASDGIEIADAAGRRFRAAGAPPVQTGDAVTLAVRPEKFAVATGADAAGADVAGAAPVNSVAGKVADIGYLGDISVYKVRLDDGTVLKASVTNAHRHTTPAIGWDDTVRLSFPPAAAAVLTE
ncbi:ABC transporter ATP-binding protein [Rhodoplanes sp. TEM]|uniref:Spermidine/putrescine import ATP-binding protein PotA n=2 Tax=Nitrobacteraceae TaxID=41294 RepID=A0ABT5JG10_RHOTP|nr:MULTISPECIES: ABC transporter ATP-binding protein [Rhodoplanes]MDC7788239.1 ABC transporter ATP-binding protein [Rhodoplanes tepidamans]MDC7982956.1 ABC transporter ATP-binding protein [Rhodoplanes sp. TEM]MDQ0355893.1 putrescine transport system ATP-binding protein [Rhodoplanes tepidamans]